VADDGPGIPPDQISQVFERHFTSDRVAGRRKGSGLGLAIVSELATAMGASVRADSPVAEGRGTTMTLWFRPGTAAPPPPPRAEPEGRGAPWPIGTAAASEGRTSG
jgi:two-component system sensor histidine kinase KdpD